VSTWNTKYQARAWLRQLSVDVTREMEDAVLTTIARLDGKPFPTTRGLAQGWLTGRLRSVDGSLIRSGTGPPVWSVTAAVKPCSGAASSLSSGRSCPT